MPARHRFHAGNDNESAILAALSPVCGEKVTILKDQLPQLDLIPIYDLVTINGIKVD
ncbi:MAG: hypothetical protein Q8R79_03115 [Legionellaceae bacterium]|nr:hypothetical protein [Legionellaceae bacterium]